MDIEKIFLEEYSLYIKFNVFYSITVSTLSDGSTFLYTELSVTCVIIRDSQQEHSYKSSKYKVFNVVNSAEIATMQA